jgi:hypothetical protein
VQGLAYIVSLGARYTALAGTPSAVNLFHEAKPNRTGSTRLSLPLKLGVPTVKFSSCPKSSIRLPRISAISLCSLLAERSRLQILRILFVLFVSCAGLAQSSSDGSFSVRHFKNANYSLPPAQMSEAESIYRNVCTLVQREFRRGAVELHPHFTVVIGTDRNEVHSRRMQGEEIWMKKWDPITFAEGVVVLSFDEMLTHDVIAQLSNKGLRLSSAAVDVADLK